MVKKNSSPIVRGSGVIVFLLLPLIFAPPLFAGATYITDSDNENNAGTGSADGDLDKHLDKDNAEAPLEFNINVSGVLPSDSAYLTIQAYDIEEERGEVDSVYFNGHLLGYLRGENDAWNSSAFELNPGWVLQGDNLVEIEINAGYREVTNNPFWAVTVDSGQLLIDGGAEDKGDTSGVDIVSYYIDNDEVSINTTTTIQTIAGGDFRLEISLIHPDGGASNVNAHDLSTNPNETHEVDQTVTYDLGNTSGVYTIQAQLFYINGTVLEQQDIETRQFHHEQDRGPIDIDNDGLTNVAEQSIGTDIFNPDSDADGIEDGIEVGPNANNPLDNDSDGVINALDPCFPNANSDPCLALSNVGQDTDNDGVFNSVDFDDDNDGIPDVVESNEDADGDGIIDSLDLDSDNDGIPDLVEAGGEDLDANGRVDNPTDIDNDGLADIVDPRQSGLSLLLLDTDFDTVKDFLDRDSDNDGITDLVEANGKDVDGNGVFDDLTDADNDGLADAVEFEHGGFPLPLPDTDFDGLRDYRDSDSDSDNLLDLVEGGGTDSDGNGIVDDLTDSDNDGLVDTVDPDNGGVALPVPDSDGDGVRDFQDPDIFIIEEAALDDSPVGGSFATASKGIGSNGPVMLLLLVLAATLRRRPRATRPFFYLGALTIVLASTFASAQEEMPEQQQAGETNTEWNWVGTWYLGADLGLSRIEPEDNSPSQDITDTKSEGFRLLVGYDLLRKLSLEAYYLDLGAAQVSGTNPPTGVLGDINYKLWGAGINYRPFFLDKKLLPYIKAGVGHTSNSVTNTAIVYEKDHNVGVFIGIGLVWRFAERWSLNVESVSYDDDALFMSVGVRKRFGGLTRASMHELDSDGDGVMDANDICPATVPGSLVDERGCALKLEKTEISDSAVICPAPIPGEALDAKECEIPDVVVLKGVHFETASRKLKADAKTVLDIVSDFARCAGRKPGCQGLRNFPARQ